MAGWLDKAQSFGEPSLERYQKVNDHSSPGKDNENKGNIIIALVPAICSLAQMCIDSKQ